MSSMLRALFFGLSILWSLRLWTEEPDSIRAIVLVDNPEDLLSPEALESVEGVDATQVALPGSLSSLEKELSPFLTSGTNWSAELIKDVKQTIYRYYQEQGYPLVLISSPPQHRETHVLQIVVQESQLDKVSVKGNRWTQPKQVERYLSIEPGDRISQRKLSRDVDFINRNPFRHVNVIYSPGQKENTTDLTLEVQDRKPYRFYTGMDNTGVSTTGRQRVFAGVNWDQVFGLDHTVFYQYTTGFQVNTFHANTFQYLMFLPWKHLLDLYGGFSIVRAHIAFPSRDNKGTNIQGSLRYHVPLLPWRFSSHELVFGFDLKNTNNTMEFVEFFATVGQTVNLSQFTLGYKGKYQREAHLFEGGIEAVISPMEWLPNQSREAFETLRPDADNQWVYLTGYFSTQQPLPYGCSLSAFARIQWTDQVLLPSEQLGLGGYGSIRGYDERQYNADTGAFGSVEVHTPPFSIFRAKQPNADQMNFLLFLDAGGGYDVAEIFGLKKQNYLIGAGPGVRYHFGSYLTARLDWGIKLHHQTDFTGGDSMLHFSFTGSY